MKLVEIIKRIDPDKVRVQHIGEDLVSATGDEITFKTAPDLVLATVVASVVGESEMTGFVMWIPTDLMKEVVAEEDGDE